MIIGVDARSLVAQKTGFGFFLQNTLDALLEIDSLNQYVLFTDREIDYKTDAKNVRICRYQDGLLIKKTFYYRWCLAGAVRRTGIKLDVFWGTMHFMPKGLDNDVLKVLTVHDFTPYKFPRATTWYNRLVTKLLFPASVGDSDVLVADSDSTLHDIDNYVGSRQQEKRRYTIYLAGTSKGEVFSRDSVEVDERFRDMLDGRFVLFTGTIEPRKDIRTLIEAAPLLKGIAVVVVCGKLGWETDEIKKQLENTDNLVYLGYVSLAERQWLMSHAFCQIQPSLYEGFGLPVVECIQDGGICLVADNSSLREIIQLEDLRFKTGDSKKLVQKLKVLIADKWRHESARQYCQRRAKDFSWEKTAQKYLSIFQSGRLSADSIVEGGNA